MKNNNMKKEGIITENGKYVKFDIVVLKDKIVQYLGKEMDNGAIVQDIHTRKELIHIALIQRKATKDEAKWFCERTENIQFTSPLIKLHIASKCYM